MKRRSRETHEAYTQLSLDAILPTSGALDEDLGPTQSVSPRTVEAGDALMPELLGRYEIAALLGEGGYGRVFKAFDTQLQRHVAIKIPHRYRISSQSQLDRHLDEARTLAKLEHPSIVAIHDVLLTDDGVPCIVSAYIDGSSLAERMKAEPLTLRRALEVLSEIGRALAFVHSRGIVHRDIKPGNILLTHDEKPYLADFGLALHDEALTPTKGRVGTPAYMSPEQARGENHLVDGRSDIFSLGVILYQMLTGHRPFGGSDHESIVQSLMHREPQPPRQLISSIPKDLERICLKALAKRASDRYSTASDLVDDVEHFLAACGDESFDDVTYETGEAPPTSEAIFGVVPRGLRSYDRHDAEFFHRLIPGARDRDWVPESLRFWQRRITGPEDIESPRIGILYGPSGCGKSSFVKAGLLPLLGRSVSAVFVEATHDETEMRLLRGLRKRVPDLRLDSTLSQSIAEIRRKYETAGSGKLLLVIDQFEQWLHARDCEADSELAAALRQCDGHHIQCLLLVRDDFWLALSRFMSVLEIPVRQNHNAALVDLFSPAHARRVLAEFGVAYDRIPAEVGSRTVEQKQFLDRSIEELSERGKVFPVRLALFVEMLKNQPWEIETLDRLGGVEGIGFQFLEESFSSELAPAAQRTHEPAVRRVLRLLLPEPGVDIKGKMQSEEALLDASGYQDRASLFDEMIRILDTDLRLITPTDPAGTVSGDDSLSQSSDGAAYYQLTHDYLVPAVERWITRRQRATRQGRAELRLAEYTSLWALKPSKKYVPPWFDWLSIRLLSSPSRWNAMERKMMRSATSYHIQRSVLVAALLLLCGLVGWAGIKHNRATALVDQLQSVRNEQLDELLGKIHAERWFAPAALREALASSEAGSREETLNRLGLLGRDASQREPLIRDSLGCDIPLLMEVAKQLGGLTDREAEMPSTCLADSGQDPLRRLKAAILLGAQVTESGEPWPLSEAEAEAIVAEMLHHASVAPQDNSHLIAAFTPLTGALMPPLLDRALEPEESVMRSLSTGFAIQFLRDRPAQLLEFLLDASFAQHEPILTVLGPQLEGELDQIRSHAFGEIPGDLAEPKLDRLARRQGVAAALLHRVGQAESTWPLMRLSDRPHTRGYLINRIGPLGGDFRVLLSRFPREIDTPVRRALLLSLGKFDWGSIPEPDRAQAILTVKDTFTTDPDVGTHSAAEWLLRRWGQEDWVRDELKRQAGLPPHSRKFWYVTAEGHTMGIFDGRDDPDIGRVFAIATHEVNVAQFKRFRPDHQYYEHRSPTDDCPLGMTHWFDCLAYCRWLNGQISPEQEPYGYPPELNENNLDVPFDEVTEHGAYRLPTAAEWRFACAATTASRRYYGYSDELAEDYFWHADSSRTADREIRYYPSGLKMPNDFGMFAMYDGVREWCHDRRQRRRAVMGWASSSERDQPSTELDRPIHMFPSDLPMSVNGYYGLRIARTITDE